MLIKQNKKFKSDTKNSVKKKDTENEKRKKNANIFINRK